jgi:FeS assembly SUF system protein
MAESTEQPTPEELMERIVSAMRSCYDPEIPVNIYDLGLIYAVDLEAETSKVQIKMTLTSPACPVAGSLPGEVQTRVREVPGVADAEVELVWDPPWSPERMSEEARLQLNL